MTRRAVKPNQPIPITTALNISALAREHGVSRKTIQRRLAQGWRPGVQGAVPSARTPVAARAHPRAGQATHKNGKVCIAPISPAVMAPRTPTSAHVRPPLGVVRGVLLLLAVAFYVFVACAALHR